MAIFYFLMLFMIVAAIIAVETDNLLSSIICVGAIGCGSSLMFLFLFAPDIAITQIVVEVLSLIILIRSCSSITRDLTFISGDREFFEVVVSVVVVFVIFLAGAQVLQGIPPFGTPAYNEIPGSASQVYVEKNLRDTGAANIVAGIILDYRGYDTLGEATVLFTSILGATVILRERARKLLKEPE
jgi:multisubunit Na+/H+ antiporter MnhB subunit